MSYSYSDAARRGAALPPPVVEHPACHKAALRKVLAAPRTVTVFGEGLVRNKTHASEADSQQEAGHTHENPESWAPNFGDFELCLPALAALAKRPDVQLSCSRGSTIFKASGNLSQKDVDQIDFFRDHPAFADACRPKDQSNQRSNNRPISFVFDDSAKRLVKAPRIAHDHGIQAIFIPCGQYLSQHHSTPQDHAGCAIAHSLHHALRKLQLRRVFVHYASVTSSFKFCLAEQSPESYRNFFATSDGVSDFFNHPTDTEIYAKKPLLGLYVFNSSSEVDEALVKAHTVARKFLTTGYVDSFWEPVLSEHCLFAQDVSDLKDCLTPHNVRALMMLADDDHGLLENLEAFDSLEFLLLTLDDDGSLSKATLAGLLHLPRLKILRLSLPPKLLASLRRRISEDDSRLFLNKVAWVPICEMFGDWPTKFDVPPDVVRPLMRRTVNIEAISDTILFG
eukprot:m.291236 g.291236  ORF g.291236 m.291236 type:complete len:452 (+) comp12441_c0_seq1:171-1526(+)